MARARRRAARADLDGHLLFVDRATGRGYDLYQATHATGESWDCTVCATTDLSGTGVRPPEGGPTPWYESHGARACGFPLAAGLVRVEEIRAGHIDHALVLGDHCASISAGLGFEAVSATLE